MTKHWMEKSKEQWGLEKGGQGGRVVRMKSLNKWGIKKGRVLQNREMQMVVKYEGES